MSNIEEVNYRDHILKVQPLAHGWRIEIHSPDDDHSEPPVLRTNDFEAREACIAEAQIVIDRLLDA